MVVRRIGPAPTTKRWRHLHKARLVRVIVDILLVNASLMLATSAACLVDVARHAGDDGVAALMDIYQRSFLYSVGILTLLSFAAFKTAGFYASGLKYRGQNKALVIVLAVAASHTALWVVARALSLHEVQAVPLIISMILSSGLIVGARMWSQFWKGVAMDEWRAHEVPVAAERARNVLVIGGAGYVGSALLPMLLERGYYVRLLDLFMYGDEPIRGVLGHRNLEVIRGDFRHLDIVADTMYGMDAVIHLGAIVGDPACSLNEEFTLEVNLTATRMVAELAKANGIRRFIFASTCSVYGASDDFLNEDSGLNPISLYARTKLASERVLRMMANHNFQPTILRFGTIYGLSGRTRFDLVVNLLTAKAIKEKVITVFGPDQWRPFLHVQDAASAVLNALESPLRKVANEIFNVGSSEQNRTLGQIGELVNGIVPEAKLVVTGVDGDRRNYRVDFAKISKQIGFKPAWTIEGGVRQVVDAFKSGAVVDYGDAKYSNVKFLAQDQGRIVRTESEWLRSLVEDIHTEDPGVVAVSAAAVL